MAKSCSYCGADNPQVARFCRRCGRSFTASSTGSAVPQSKESAEPLACPTGFSVCSNNEHFYWRWEAVDARSFFGCEYIGVTLLNGGPDVVDVRVRITGYEAGGQVFFTLERKIHRLDRGQPISLEIPGHEVAKKVPDRLEVAIVATQSPESQDRSPERRNQPWWCSSP